MGLVIVLVLDTYAAFRCFEPSTRHELKSGTFVSLLVPELVCVTYPALVAAGTGKVLLVVELAGPKSGVYTRFGVGTSFELPLS